MHTRLDRAHRAVPVALGVLTLVGVGVLFACDLFPSMFPACVHVVFAAFPLTTIAIAYLLYQNVHRPLPMEWLKAILLALAFLFWAANQVWRNPHQAMIFNDIAIALFVLDVFLVMIGWPSASPDESFAESFAAKPPSQENGSHSSR